MCNERESGGKYKEERGMFKIKYEQAWLQALDNVKDSGRRYAMRARERAIAVTSSSKSQIAIRFAG